MTAEEIYSQLYERMLAEQDKYRDWLLTQSPEEVLKVATKEKSHVIEMTLQGARNCISVGKGVIRALGEPSHVSLKISDNHDSLSVFPCDEDDVMAFRVPVKLLTDHHCVMRINSKRFVHGIMRSNNMDITRTYTLSGEYIKDMNTCVFSLVDGVTMRALIVRERQTSDVQDN